MTAVALNFHVDGRLLGKGDFLIGGAARGVPVDALGCGVDVDLASFVISPESKAPDHGVRGGRFVLAGERDEDAGCAVNDSHAAVGQEVDPLHMHGEALGVCTVFHCFFILIGAVCLDSAYRLIVTVSEALGRFCAGIDGRLRVLGAGIDDGEIHLPGGVHGRLVKMGKDVRFAGGI